MIEFKGSLAGEAERRFFEKVRYVERVALFISMAVVYPFIILFSIRIDVVSLTFWYPMLFVVFFLITLIPKSKKEKDLMLPKSITINQEYLTCVTGRGKEQRVHADVKEVQDCKTYYEIVFRFGKSSPVFICQKDLMTQGTIEEFEELFKGKIDDLTDYFE